MTLQATAARRTVQPAPGPGPHDGLLHVDPTAGRFALRRVDALPELLQPGDLLVVNDAATLPAALAGRVRGEPVEVRLARQLGPDRWEVGLLGAGSWRTPTERRALPPVLSPGDVVVVGPELELHVEEVRDRRIATVRLVAPHGRWLDAVHRLGEPVRYAYLAGRTPLAPFQTAFATRPWASESPSAALPLTWRSLLALRRRGVGLARLTHAAGLSSLDGGALDATLPWPERSDVPEDTVAAIEATRGRVVAVGTTVVRALEGRVRDQGALRPGEAETSLVIGPGFRPRVVDGLLTKLHAPDESHFAVVAAFAPPALLARGLDAAGQAGWHHHEFGDAALVLASRP
ncbi:MAG: S-adenosylmethionine:tRNA ribosyltransferase-isomerase [Myxococcota bacterium]